MAVTPKKSYGEGMRFFRLFKTYWELEPFEYFREDPTESIVIYVAGLFFFFLVVGNWTLEPLMFFTSIYILVEFTKMIIR